MSVTFVLRRIASFLILSFRETPSIALSIPKKNHLEKHFTFLRVDYINPISTVDISFDPDSNMLTIYQKFPFITMPIGVHGYSMPLGHTEQVITTTTRRYRLWWK
ncbi:hypothetical protein ABMA27_007429 [Loxostege sticticalis]|uniref:Uncharacterized protein n=1 Tax=Loxostege sticticalis TaxID=481309 RepID=A0ABR3HFE3_LOXSC